MAACVGCGMMELGGGGVECDAWLRVWGVV